MFLILYMLAMVLPGAGLVYALRLNVCRTALSIALSFSVLVVALILARSAGLGVLGFGFVLVGVYVMITLGMGIAWWLRPPASFSREASDAADNVWIVPVLTLGAVAGYMVWAGPYIEVPSDAWWHIARINDRVDDAAAGTIGSSRGFTELFDKQAGYWYTVAAYLMQVTRTSLEPGLWSIALGNMLLISAAVYSFALFVFSRIVTNRWSRYWIAAATVFFFATHFGISVFSYVRYYIYAPTLINFIVYLAAVASILRFMQEERGEWRFLAVAGVLTLVAGLVHLQEAVFILVMSGAVVLVEVLRNDSHGFVNSGSNPRNGSSRARKRVVIVLGIGAVAYLCVHAWAYLEVSRHNPLYHGVMADIRNYLPFLQNLYVLKPTLQFYQVITAWGVLVYILFLTDAKRFANSPYLVAGMSIPALTVFNPVFTDLFLRFSWPEVLWRMCYMLPLPFVGGYFLVTGVQTAALGAHPFLRIRALVLAGVLILLLFPIHTTYFVSPHTKIYTLAPVAAANDHRAWGDLLAFLDTVERARVVTDPVTGYVINGLTPHRYPGYKFYGDRTMRVDKEEYLDGDFDTRKGWLVVVNQRDGASSETGRHGGHWPPDIMKVSGHYSPAFVEYVRNRSGVFEKLWESDRISVYKVTLSDD